MHLRHKSILSLFIVLVLFVAGVGQQKPATNEGVRSEMLVSTKWLADHLKDPNVVVLHIADSVGDYKRGHIPGARYLAMKDFSYSEGPINTELPSVEQLTKKFGELGITDKTRVVLYATNWFPNAARAYFTLDYLGHANTALLDGGVEQWVSENRPVSGETPKFAAATFTPHVRENARALMDEVKAVVESKPGEETEQIIDARPARRYTAGHLAGASNIYWQDTLVSEDNPVFQSPEKLRALYASRGIVPGKKIVTYCEVGLQASHGYFLAKYLGYDAAMYDGSYSEWTSKNMPVIKGEAKR
ncbi:MAG: Thiosulfate sulfurtransferase [Acidobacteriales bacterium]|nr:Thiosulfate sulfurtransferase [Terriglobales bacterium]